MTTAALNRFVAYSSATDYMVERTFSPISTMEFRVAH